MSETSIPAPDGAGVYCITCTAEGPSFGKFYVGSTVNLARRERDHRYQLNRGKHYARHLQRAWNKYGSQAFEWSVLEYVPTEGLTIEEFRLLLITREQYHIDGHDAVRRGFNQSPKAGSCLGVKLAAEALANHSEASRRMAQNPAWLANVTEANRRTQQDPAYRASRAEAARRNWQDPAFRAKSVEAMRRVAKNPVRLAKITEANRRREQDPAYRTNHAEAMRRRSQNSTWRGKQSGAAIRRERRKRLAKRAKAKLVQLMLFD